MPLRPFILAIHFSGLFLIAGGSRVQPRIPCLKRNINMRSRGAISVRGLSASPSIRGGCRECRVLAAPAVSCAMCTRKCAHEHTGTAGARRHSLRNGLTAYAALSLETNSSCLHRCRLDGEIDPVGPNSPPTAWHQPRVSGPHGFAVRFSAVRLARCTRSRKTALRTLFAPDAAASTTSRLAFVTIAIRPSCRDGTARQ